MDPTLQNGIDTNGEEPDSAGGLVTKTGLEGCLPVSSNVPGAPEVPEIPISGPVISVSSSTIRPEQCPSHVYQAHETSPSIAEEAGDPTDHDMLILARTRAEAKPLPDHSGIHHQPEEKYYDTDPDDRIPWVPVGLIEDEDLSPTGQAS